MAEAHLQAYRNFFRAKGASPKEIQKHEAILAPLMELYWRHPWLTDVRDGKIINVRIYVRHRSLEDTEYWKKQSKRFRGKV